MGEVGRRQDHLHPADRARDLVRDLALEALGRPEHVLGVACHLRRDQREVDIVRVVGEGVVARVLGLGEVGLVGLDRGDVGAQRIEVAADPEPGVGRHVDDVAGARHQRGQAVGVGLGALGRRRGLGQVDVEVDRARMVGIGGQHLLDRGDRLAGAALGGAAVGLPVVPGRGVHDRIRKQHGDFLVIGKTRVHRGHCIGIGAIERGALLAAHVALAEGRDQRLLDRARPAGARLGVGDRDERGALGGAVHRRVDVGAENEGLAPPAHRAVGIPPLRLLERAQRLGVVEGVGQPETLIEVALRDRVGGGDRMAVRAEVVEQGRRLAGRRGRGGARHQQLVQPEGAGARLPLAADPGGEQGGVEQLRRAPRVACRLEGAADEQQGGHCRGREQGAFELPETHRLLLQMLRWPARPAGSERKGAAISRAAPVAWISGWGTISRRSVVVKPARS